MGEKRRKRTRDDIVATILSAAASPERKTHIMYRANLNYSLIEECLRSLVAAGLLEEAREEGATTYKTTVKGLGFLSVFKTLRSYQASELA